MADLFLGTQQCATKEEYRRSMAELVETGRLHLNMKEVNRRHLVVLIPELAVLAHKLLPRPKNSQLCLHVRVNRIESICR